MIKLYNEKCHKCITKVSDDKLKVFTDYFFATFMTHYKLYQYVFSKAREDHTKKEILTVETPQEPERLYHGKPEVIWEYEEKLKELDEAASERQKELDLKLQSAQMAKEEQFKRSIETLDETTETSLTREVTQASCPTAIKPNLTTLCLCSTFLLAETLDLFLSTVASPFQNSFQLFIFSDIAGNDCWHIKGAHWCCFGMFEHCCRKSRGRSGIQTGANKRAETKIG